MRLHKGDICFPGGKANSPDEDTVTTALREAQEEIGLDPRHVSIIGRLAPCIPINSSMTVTPVIALLIDIDKINLKKCEAEVCTGRCLILC